MLQLPVTRIFCHDKCGRIMSIPRSQAFERLKTGIKLNGLKTPIFINQSQQVLAGHYRFLACVALGLRDVPVKLVNSLKDVDYGAESQKNSAAR